MPLMHFPQNNIVGYIHLRWQFCQGNPQSLGQSQVCLLVNLITSVRGHFNHPFPFPAQSVVPHTNHSTPTPAKSQWVEVTPDGRAPTCGHGSSTIGSNLNWTPPPQHSRYFLGLLWGGRVHERTQNMFLEAVSAAGLAHSMELIQKQGTCQVQTWWGSVMWHFHDTMLLGPGCH